MPKKVEGWALAICCVWTAGWLVLSLGVVFSSWSSLERLESKISKPTTVSSATASNSPKPAARPSRAAQPARKAVASKPASKPTSKPRSSASAKKPAASSSRKAANTSKTAKTRKTSSPPQAQIPILGWHQRGSFDLGMLILALAFGAIGAAAHALYVIGGATADRDFAWSRVGWFGVQPPLGAVLGMLIYITIRIGFVAGGVGEAPTNMLGVAAAAAVAGLSSKKAYERLVPKTDPGKPRPGPVITGVRPRTITKDQNQVITVEGRNLDSAAFEINGHRVTPVAHTSHSATIHITADQATGERLTVALKGGKSQRHLPVQ